MAVDIVGVVNFALWVMVAVTAFQFLGKFGGKGGESGFGEKLKDKFLEHVRKQGNKAEVGMEKLDVAEKRVDEIEKRLADARLKTDAKEQHKISEALGLVGELIEAYKELLSISQPGAAAALTSQGGAYSKKAESLVGKARKLRVNLLKHVEEIIKEIEQKRKTLNKQIKELKQEEKLENLLSHAEYSFQRLELGSKQVLTKKKLPLIIGKKDEDKRFGVAKNDLIKLRADDRALRTLIGQEVNAIKAEYATVQKEEEALNKVKARLSTTFRSVREALAGMEEIYRELQLAGQALREEESLAKTEEEINKRQELIDKGAFKVLDGLRKFENKYIKKEEKEVEKAAKKATKGKEKVEEEVLKGI
ncbi:hypothetical protein JXB11_01515 [Candidatus Woesearchaeota archaeon]|nr:hypothetical protein [Candidatus Woesearchaeota archaeon]